MTLDGHSPGWGKRIKATANHMSEARKASYARQDEKEQRRKAEEMRRKTYRTQAKAEWKAHGKAKTKAAARDQSEFMERQRIEEKQSEVDALRAAEKWRYGQRARWETWESRQARPTQVKIADWFFESWWFRCDLYRVNVGMNVVAFFAWLLAGGKATALVPGVPLLILANIGMIRLTGPMCPVPTCHLHGCTFPHRVYVTLTEALTAGIR